MVSDSKDYVEHPLGLEVGYIRKKCHRGSEVNEVRLRMQAELEVEVCVRNETKNRFRKTPDARRVVVFCEC